MGGALGVLGVGYAGRSQRRMRRVNRSAARLSRGGIGDLPVECVKEVSGRVFSSIWGAGAPWERPPTDYLKERPYNRGGLHMKNATIKFLLPNAFPISKHMFLQ